MENNETFKIGKAKFILILILILIGIALCIELGYIYYKTNFLESYAQSFCTISEQIDCDGVAKTSYAVMLGVPNAIWGLLLYCVMLMLLFVDKIQAKFKNTIFDVFKNPYSYIAVLGVISFIISMGLAFISIKVINKICVLCFCTYFINFFVALLAKQKGFFFGKDILNTIVDFLDGAKKHFILFIIVLLGFSATLYYLDSSLILAPGVKQERKYKELDEYYQAKQNKYAVKGNILGKKDAKVTIKIYSDYRCPHCKIVNTLLHRAAKERNILVQEVNFPLDTSCNKKIGGTLGGHENSCLYAKFALAAQKQDFFWGASNLLFHNEPQTQDEIVELFKQNHFRFDENKLKSDANSPEIAQKLENDIEETSKKEIPGTPVIEINGVRYMGSMPYDELLEKIDLELKRNN